MIIKQVDITNYGKWHHVTISFHRGLSILYGRNEAGKTTLLSFIKGVLFGYLQRRTSHKNYIPRNSKNYGGQLEVSVNGRDYIIKRMAGKNGGLLTVLNSHGDQLGNSTLKKILGPFDRNTFDALYYFGTVNLKRLGKLRKRDLVYRIQRIGLAHSDDWINYREDLTKQSKKLYSPQGYKPVLNQKLKLYSRLTDQIKDARQDYYVYQGLLQQIKHFHQRQRDLTVTLNCQSDRADQLNQDQNMWTRYQKMRSLDDSINQPVSSGFSNDDGQRLQALNNQSIRIKNQVKLIRQQIHEASIQRVDDDSIEYYQQHRQIIDRLSERFNKAQNKLERLRLIKRSNVDVNNQLERLKHKYTINNHQLMPLNQVDFSAINQIFQKTKDNQNRFQMYTRKLATTQDVLASSRVTTNDYLIYGVSVLLIIIGVVTVFPLSIFGLIIGLGWFLNRSRHERKDRTAVDHIRGQIKGCQGADIRLNRKIRHYQGRYHYPTKSIEHWLGMQDGLKRFTHLRKRVKTIGMNINQLTEQLNSYFKQWAFMNRQLTLSSNQNDQLQQLKNYVNKMNRAVKLNRHIDVQRHKYLIRLKVAQNQQQQNGNKLTNFYYERHVKDAHDFKTHQQQQKELVQRKQLYDELLKQVGSSELRSLERYSNYDDLKKLINTINQQIDHSQSQLRMASVHQAAAQTKLKQMVRSGSYDELQQRIANVKTEINELVHSWLEESLASQWINAALNLATKGRVPKIERQAQNNFKILTGQRYVSIIFSKTKIKVMRRDKRRFTLYELSKGTVQQLYLALIFAMAQVFGSDYPMPVLIDDGFTDFDVNRRKAAIKLLKLISNRLQVIYCTSDENLAGRDDVINLDQI